MTQATTAVVAFDPSKFQAMVGNMAKGAHAQVGYMKMDKTGSWVTGADEAPIPDEAVIYVDPMGFVHGWQCWLDTDKPGVTQAKILGEVIVPMFEPLPPCPDKVPEGGRAWAELRGMSCMVDGQKMVYSVTSIGGLKAIASLAESYAVQFAKDPTKMIARIRLESDSYKHKNPTFGRIYVPVLEVAGWVGKLPQTEAAVAIEAAVNGPAPVKTAAGKSLPKRRKAA